jgi:hypothetical protein
MAGGVGVFDYNRDGRPDIFFTNGASISSLKKDSPKYSNRLLRNDGHGVFTDVTKAAGAAGLGYDNGVAIGDYDNEGEAEIWVNRTEGAGHWLGIQLEGTKSNRDGIGAVVKVVTKAGAQWNHMTSSVGYASSSYGPVHFGLGPEDKAEQVEIRWPSGLVQTIRNVAGDRVLKVRETGGQ